LIFEIKINHPLNNEYVNPMEDLRFVISGESRICRGRRCYGVDREGRKIYLIESKKMRKMKLSWW